MKRALPLLFLFSCTLQPSFSRPGESDPVGGQLPPPSGASGPVAYEGEDSRFEDAGSNPFLRTSDAPFSTFGVDVDTASYQYFLRRAGEGQLPEPASVRTEDFVNYFAYGYERPDGEAARLAISASASRGGLGRDTSLLRVTLTAPSTAASEKRPANLVYLVDVSGSMSGVIGLVQKTLKASLDVLDPTDKIAIVTYAGNTSVRLTPTPVSSRDAIVAAIDGLNAGGSTAGSAGLDLAYQQAQAGFIEGGINHVLLCTDGDFNVGPSSDAELLAQIKTKRDSGVTLTVLGYGSDNYQAAKMEKISNAGNGVAGYIADEDQAISYVHSRLLSTFDHVASDAKVQLEFNPAKVLAYRLIGYENRVLNADDFKDDAVDAGEIGSGLSVTALYELVFADDAQPEVMMQKTCTLAPLEASLPAREITEDAWLLMKVRYKDSRNLTDVREHRVTLTELPGAFADAEPDLKYATAVAALAEILKQSPFAANAQLPAIAEILAAQKDRDPARAELAQLFAGVRAKLDALSTSTAEMCTYAQAE